MKYIYSLINFYLMEQNECELFIDKKTLVQQKVITKWATGPTPSRELCTIVLFKIFHCTHKQENGKELCICTYFV